MPLPEHLIAHLASRLHRLHHFLWHLARDNWNDLSADQRQAIQALEPGWVAQRPSWDPGLKRPEMLNASGEDFLFMHRQMIQGVQAMLAKAGLDALEGWASVPGPTAEGENAVPPFWPIPAVNGDGRAYNVSLPAIKSDGFFFARMLWWERDFKNPTVLRGLSLGELGAAIEFSIHNYMHIRWSAAPWPPGAQTVLSPQGRPEKDLRPAWDDPRYDWLNDTYSSHVNPIFWRLHLWVDDRIHDWAEAHRAAGNLVEPRVVDGVEWFARSDWVALDLPWCGAFPMHVGEHGGGGDGHGGDGVDPRITVMEKVAGIIQGTIPVGQGAAPRGVAAAAAPSPRLSITSRFTSKIMA
jgi:hypothetical protein